MFEKNRITRIPKELRNTTAFIVIVSGLTTIIFDLFAFLLQISKDAIASGRIFLGLVCIGLYYMRNVAQISIYLWLDDSKTYQRELSEIQTDARSADVLTKVRDRVFMSNGNSMSSSQILTSIKTYLEKVWSFRLSLPSDIINVISTIITFVGFVVVTTIEVKNVVLFISVIVGISILGIYFSDMRLKCQNKSREAQKQLGEQKNEIKNDILNIEPQDEKHSSYMVNSYIESMKKSFAYEKKEWKGINKIHWLETLFNALATIFIVGIKIYEVGIPNVNLETVLSIIALQTIYSQIITTIQKQILAVESYRKKLQEIKTYEPDVKRIFKVLKEQEDVEYSDEKMVVVPRFEVEYNTGEKRYRLLNAKEVQLQAGDCIMLTGTSGSGKTTFMKMLIGKVKFKNTTFSNIVSVMHYADTKLGCQDVLSEVVFGREYDKERLLNILKGVQLYDKIAAKHSDVIEYLHSTKANNYSNGEKQRLLIARLLYNLEPNVKIVIFDEATNALDDVNAEKVVQFIREYCKSKLLVIATHQTDVWKHVATKHFDFVGNDGKYEMIEQ